MLSVASQKIIGLFTAFEHIRITLTERNIIIGLKTITKWLYFHLTWILLLWLVRLWLLLNLLGFINMWWPTRYSSYGLMGNLWSCAECHACHDWTCDAAEKATWFCLSLLGGLGFLLLLHWSWCCCWTSWWWSWTTAWTSSWSSSSWHYLCFSVKVYNKLIMSRIYIF